MRWDWAQAILALATFVALSSGLGLLIPIISFGGRIFTLVWGSSVFADFVFVSSMSAVGWFAFEAAWERRWVRAIVIGLLGAWSAYFVSWAFVRFPYSIGSGIVAKGTEGGDLSLGSLGEVAWFGWPGLLWSAGAPIAAAASLRRWNPGFKKPKPIDPFAQDPEAPPR